MWLMSARPAPSVCGACSLVAVHQGVIDRVDAIQLADYGLGDRDGLLRVQLPEHDLDWVQQEQPDEVAGLLKRFLSCRP